MSRVVFMGTPGFAVPTLKSLIAGQTVVGVVTQPDRPAGRGRHPKPSPVKEVAQEMGIPVYQPASLRSPEAAEPLRKWRPDIIVVAAFGQILRPHVLELPPHGCLNVHASLLPRWRGAAPIQYALLAGDPETGISLMQMDAGLDSGPVLAQENLAIDSRDTAATLHDKLAQIGAQMISRYLEPIVEGRLQARAQDESLVTLAPSLSKDDGLITWSDDWPQIERHIRAFNPWPGAFTTWHGKNLMIWQAEAFNVSRQAPAGTVLRLENDIGVQTGTGTLVLKQIQLAGKKRMSASDLVNGRPDFIGSKLGS